MKKKLFKLFVWLTAIPFHLAAQSSYKPDRQVSRENSKRDMVMWYKQPGEKWLEGLPLGNGMIGAMVFGGVPQE